jgi:hypothetical protein
MSLSDDTQGESGTYARTGTIGPMLSIIIKVIWAIHLRSNDGARGADTCDLDRGGEDFTSHAEENDDGEYEKSSEHDLL